MLETSKDVLNIVIAVSVFGLTAFVCWTIYYLARILQQLFGLVKDMRDRLQKLDDLIKAVKEKIEHTTSYLLLISEGVKKLVEVIRDRTEKKEEK
jgi:hypothetical protein